VVLELMAGERVVRQVSVPAARPTAPVVAAGAVLLILALLFVLVGASAILLLGCVVAGFGVTYLSGVALNLEERLAFGTVLGAMAVATAAFLLSMLARDVTMATVVLGLAAALATDFTA